MKVGAILLLCAPYAVFGVLSFALLTAFVPVRVAGQSMVPALRTGDVAVVRRDSRPTQGDIALVSQPGHASVLHRVVEVRGDGLVTKGDANRYPDMQAVDRSEVRGVVVAVLPLGRVIDWWRSM